MALKLGSNNITTAYFGSSAVSQMYQGSTALLAAPSRTPLTSQELTDAYYVFSFNLLNASYGGNCCQIRRSSDNTTQNIGFVDGKVDEAAITSFVGGGDGFLSAWYDQSGNGRYIYNTNNASQAKIVDAGTIVKVNNHIAPLYTSVGAGSGASANNYRFSTGMSVNNDMSFFHVLSKPISNQVYGWQSTVSAGHPTFIFGYNPGSGVVDAEWYAGPERYTISTSGMSTSALSLLSVTRTAPTGNVIGYFNGSQLFNNTSTQTYSGVTLKNFMSNNNDGANAHCSEFIAYTAAKTSDVTSINSNIVNYYGL